MDSHTPSQAMIEFFERRTFEHIARVQKCMFAIAAATSREAELIPLALVHDASKYSEAERIPYVWSTEFHRCQRLGLPFRYPDGMEQRIRDAIQHHYQTNRHHPEHFNDPNEMTEVDLIEMVCDWTAMAQEFDEPNGSARTWANQVLSQRLQFSPPKKRLVLEMISLLEQHFEQVDSFRSDVL